MHIFCVGFRAVTHSLTGISAAMSLKGKKAVITGGTRGIGLATARNYLKEGVVVSLRNHLVQLKVNQTYKYCSRFYG